MSTALAVINESLDSKVDLIRRNFAKDATNDELDIFLHQCKKTGLDPLAKQIYFQKRKGKMVIITGIDGYRLVADRTGKYAGNDDPEFDNPEGQPKLAKVTVYKIVEGQRCPFTATARWSQYFPGDELGFMWKKMPHLMLGKCAEALALRKAFPAELSGVYTAEEMEQAGRVGPAIHEGQEYPACEDCGEAIIGLKLGDGRELTWQEVFTKSKADHEGHAFCGPCQVKKHQAKKAIEAPKQHPVVAEMKARQIDADPDPMFSIDTAGKPVVAGTVTQISITAKSFQVHFGKERLSTFPDRSMCEYLKGSKGKFAILEYALTGDGKYKNIVAVRKLDGREFDNGVPVIGLHEDLDPPSPDMMTKPADEDLPF